MNQGSRGRGSRDRGDDYGQMSQSRNYSGSEYHGGDDVERQSYSDYGRGSEQFGSGRRGNEQFGSGGQSEQFGGYRSSWGGRPSESVYGYGRGYWDYGSRSSDYGFGSASSGYGRRSPDYDEDRYWSSNRDRDYGQSGYGRTRWTGAGGTEWGGGMSRFGQGQQNWGHSQHDDDYSHWRNEQLSKFDNDYADYQTERRKKFSEAGG